MPTPTLDAERTDQLRHYLTAEAAAGVTAGRVIHLVPRSRPGRRVALVAGAAVIVGGALFAGSAVVGGPGSHAPAAAVAFEEDGAWTTIRLADMDADPQAVLDELHAAGFDAQLDTMHVTRTTGPDGQETVSLDDPAAAGSAGTTTFMSVQAGDLGLLGLSVSLPDSAGEAPIVDDGGPTTDVGGATEAQGEVGPATEVGGSADAGALDEIDAWYEDHGVRFEDDGSVSVRNGADLTIVVFVADEG
jgi:hypothetical protein